MIMKSQSSKLRGLIAALAASTAFATLSGAATLTLNGSTFTSGSGDSITAAWTDVTNARDWLGIYPAGATPGNPSTAWFYFNGNQSAPAAAISSGSLTLPGRFADPLDNRALGTWTAHILEDDGYTSLSSFDFTVVPAAGITVSTDQSIYQPDDTITVTWGGNIGATPQDWIGIYRLGEIPGPSDTPGTSLSTAWTNIPADAVGDIDFDGLEPGTYDVYLFGYSGYHQLAQTSFQVVPEPSSVALLGFSALAALRRRRK